MRARLRRPYSEREADRLEERERLLWLWLANGLGPAADWQPVVQRYGGLEEVYAERLYLLRDAGLTGSQSDRLLSASPESMAARLRFHEERGVRVLCYPDADYPAQLRQIAVPPMVLYCRGDAGCLQNRLLIGVVGTRRPSAYGVEATAAISRGLALAGAVIVSGLAAGLDSEAHKAALAAGEKTVAVLGNSVLKYYPSQNRPLQDLIAAQGALVSEYPADDTESYFKDSFVLRNRIIAGLTRGLCVAEARLRSGTMSTLRYALEYGRDVFAVPGSIFSPLCEGTNAMLKEGAKPVCCAGDILEEYGGAGDDTAVLHANGADAGEHLSGDEKAVWEVLGARGLPLDEVCSRCGLAVGKTMAALTVLEMNGLVRQQPGRRFEKSV